MAYYVGILDGSKKVWGVRIPDVRGCYGGGASPEAAIADVTSALREFAAHQASKGIALNPPRTTQAVKEDPEAEFDATSESFVMVPLILDQARPVKANISLDAGELEAIDEAAQVHGLTRSAFVTSAALSKIMQGPKLSAKIAAAEARLKRQGEHFAAELRREMRRAGIYEKVDKRTGETHFVQREPAATQTPERVRRLAASTLTQKERAKGSKGARSRGKSSA